MNTRKKTTVIHGNSAEKLTPKQRTALKVYTETGNKTEAARAAGYSDPNANATRVFEAPAMQTAVADIFKRLNISDEELLRPIKEALNATKQETVVETRRVKEGLFVMDKLVEVKKKVPDIELRLQGTSLGTKLLRMGEGDEEYGKKMYMAGAESASQACVKLIKKLEPYLTPEAKDVLADGIREMGGGGKESRSIW